MDEDAECALLLASREASAYFDRFNKPSLYHAAAHLNVDWLLSDIPPSLTVEAQQSGLITNLSPENTGKYTLLFPKSTSPTIKQFRLQELHQVVRELVEGIYIFNQAPSISLDSNYDSTTTVSLSSAYHDSLVGEALFAVDYFVKSLLNGSTVAQKEDRVMLLEEWKKFPLFSLRDEFMANGMTEMQDDEKLGSDLYNEDNPARVRYPPKCIRQELASSQLSPRLTTAQDYQQQQDHVCRETFIQHLDQVSLGLLFRQVKIQQKNNMLMMEPVSEVVTKVLALKPESSGSSLSAHLHSYLQKQQQFVSENLHKKDEISRYVELLGFVSFMVYLLTTLKRQNKIVDISCLIPSRSKDIMRTEREIPPVLQTKSSRWSPYSSKNNHTGVNGGIDFLKSKLAAGSLEISQNEMETIQKIITSAEVAMKSVTSISSIERETPTCEIGGKQYYVIVLAVELYYSNTPKLPCWVHAMSAEMKTQAARLLQLNDARIQDMLRKPLGPRKASSLKTVNVSLQASIENDFLSPVMALLKRCTRTRLVKLDEKGMTLLHYAAARGRSDIASALIIAGSDVHQPVSLPGSPNALTMPVHLAAMTGDVECFSCLVFYGADLCEADENGWAAIHHAAYHDSEAIIRYLVTVSKLQLDFETSNKLQVTPVLLAAQNGCFNSFKCLVELGADLSCTASTGFNVVNFAAFQHQTRILQYLVVQNEEHADVWGTLSEMLMLDDSYAEVAARNLDSLTRWRPECAKQLLQNKAVTSLVQLLKKTDALQLLSVQVLANISNMDGIDQALVKAEAVSVLVKLLSSPNDRIQVHSCLVLSDLAINRETQEAIAETGAIPRLIELLHSEVDDVQLFACACIGILAYDNLSNQVVIVESRALQVLVTMLSSPLTCTQGCASEALKAILEANRSNQLKALVCKAIPPLVHLLRSKEVSLHRNAAKTIESLACDCVESQRELMSDSTCINLLKRLLHMRDQDVKVCAGCALWAIAGILISNKRLIASHMGLEMLVDMLTLHNEKLDFVCSEALGALATELGENQSRIIYVGGVKPLVEVLTIPTSQRVCLSVIHTLAALCMKPALVPNTYAQNAISASRGIVILSSIVSAKDASEIIRVEAACTLAQLLLDNPGNDKILAKHTNFSFLTIFSFFTSSDPEVRLLAGSCLAIMGFNSPDKLKEMRTIGTLNISNFVSFLESEDQLHQVHAAFQIVVLSRLLMGIRDLDAIVKGIKLLIHLLASELEQTKVLSAEYIASLSRTGNGLPGAMVMAAALDPLMMNLSVGNGPVIESTCVALGYLTFNPTAARLLTGMFRDNPELFLLFKQHFSHIVYSEKFLENWNHITRKGIPSLRYEGIG